MVEQREKGGRGERRERAKKQKTNKGCECLQDSESVVGPLARRQRAGLGYSLSCC